MSKLAKFLAVNGLIAGLAGGTWAHAQAQDQNRATRGEGTQRQEAEKTREQKAVLKDGGIDLRKEIASPITGAFSTDAMRTTVQPNVGGFNGNGFLNPAGQPSSIPGNPGTY